MPIDVNLTHAIAANVTLTQSWPNPELVNALIAFGGGAIVAIISAYVTLKNNKKIIDANYEIMEKTIEQEKFKMVENERQEKENKRREAYSQLHGRKHTMSQSYASYYSSVINSRSLLYNADLIAFDNVDFEIVNKLRGDRRQDKLQNANQYITRMINSELDQSIEIKEGLRAKQRCEELQLEKSKYIERFWETIGQIKILFPSKKVLDLVNNIEKSENRFEGFGWEIVAYFDSHTSEIETYAGPKISSNVDRHKFVVDKRTEWSTWEYKKYKELEDRIKELESKIGDLLIYLETEMNGSNTSRSEGELLNKTNLEEV